MHKYYTYILNVAIYYVYVCVLYIYCVLSNYVLCACVPIVKIFVGRDFDKNVQIQFLHFGL